MSRLIVKEIRKSYGGQELFKDISLSLDPSDKLALIGPNGCGKSTFLRILKGLENPDNGQITINPAESGIGFCQQELTAYAVHKPLLSWVMQDVPSWSDFWEKWEEARKKEDHSKLQRLSKEQNYLEELYGFTPEPQARSILQGLGFDQGEESITLQELSGGWRERGKLARALLNGRDILLLDEPTNHLDLEALRWLESFLINYRGILVLVAHDRYFLDRIVNKTICLVEKNARLLKGNFSQFIEWQKEREKQRQREMESIQRQINHMQQFVDRFRYKASKASLAQSRLKKIETLQGQKNSLQSDFIEEKQLSFDWIQPKRSGKTVLSSVDLGFGYQGQNFVFQNLSFNVYRGQKIGIVGKNGSGKSTLLKLIHGDLEPANGVLTLGSSVEMGYFSQHIAETLFSENKVLSEIRRLSPEGKKEEELRSSLGLFLLGEEFWTKKVKDLSGGEKNRLVLASLFLAEANFLLLDEPTNHLDIASREALVQALSQFPGTVMLITHDRHLLNQVTDEIWVLENHSLEPLKGGYQEYEERISQKKEDRQRKNSLIPKRKDIKERRRKEAEWRNQLYRELKPKKERYKSLERELEGILEELTFLEDKLSLPETYQKGNQVEDLNLRYTKLQEKSEQIIDSMHKLEQEINDLEECQRSAISI